MLMNDLRLLLQSAEKPFSGSTQGSHQANGGIEDDIKNSRSNHLECREEDEIEDHVKGTRAIRQQNKDLRPCLAFHYRRHDISRRTDEQTWQQAKSRSQVLEKLLEFLPNFPNGMSPIAIQ